MPLLKILFYVLTSLKIPMIALNQATNTKVVFLTIPHRLEYSMYFN